DRKQASAERSRGDPCARPSPRRSWFAVRGPASSSPCLVLMFVAVRRRAAASGVHWQDGTPNAPEVNVSLSTIGRIDGGCDFYLGRNARRRTLLWQSGGPGAAKARGIALCTAKNFARPVRPSRSSQVSCAK